MTDTTRPLSGRHPVNVGQLVMGLAFLGLLAVWALVQAGVVDDHDVRWLLPVPWVAAGAIGLLATTLSSRRRRGEHPGWGTHQTGWVQPESSGQQDWGRHHTGWVRPAYDDLRIPEDTLPAAEGDSVQPTEPTEATDNTHSPDEPDNPDTTEEIR